jgi:hypothetical protein
MSLYPNSSDDVFDAPDQVVIRKIATPNGEQEVHAWAGDYCSPFCSGFTHKDGPLRCIHFGVKLHRRNGYNDMGEVPLPAPCREALGIAGTRKDMAHRSIAAALGAAMLAACEAAGMREDADGRYLGANVLETKDRALAARERHEGRRE